MLIVLNEIWKRLRLIGWFCIDNWKIVLPVVLTLAVIIVGWKACNSYRWNKTDKELQQLEQKTSEAQVDVWAAEQNKKDAEKKANEAINNINAIRNSDSSNHNGDFSTAKRKFCEQYPSDSMCR